MIGKYLNPEHGGTVHEWAKQNLKNYLTKVDSKTGMVPAEDYQEIEHILDYLNSDKAPSRLSRMSYLEAKAGAAKWVATLIKKGNKVVETEDDTEIVKDFGDGFKMVKLVSQEAYSREGSLMRHCVGSYKGNASEIYSLRDSSNAPHCTMEIQRNGEHVNQIKGKGNGPIHPKYIKYVMQMLEEMGVTVNSYDMENLGYVAGDTDVWDFLAERCKPVKFMNFGGVKYFYKHQKVEMLNPA